MLLVRVGAVDDDLGRRLPMDGPVQLVLHSGEEALGGLRGVTEHPRRWGTHGFEAGYLMVVGSNAIAAGAWSGSGYLM